MIRQGADGGGLDLLAVQRDDELLDLLGARRGVSDGDEVARLLAALVADVDDALPALPLAPARSAAPVPVAETPGHTRRLGAAGVAAAVLLGGSVAMSGAAAAVTGDPLAPYKTVGHAVGTVGSAVGTAVGAVGEALSFGDDDLPEQAAPVAHLNKRLAGARAALAHGDTTQVQALVEELTAVLATADLSDEQRAALQQRLDKLEDSLTKAAQGPQDGTAKGGGKPATERTPEGKAPEDRTPEDKAPADRAPQDKAPQDKAPQDKAPADQAPVDRAPEDKAPADKAPADKAPQDKAPDSGGGSDTSGGATSDPTSDVTQQQVPTPQPQVTGGSGGGGRGSASQQSTEPGADPTEPRGQGASRR